MEISERFTLATLATEIREATADVFILCPLDMVAACVGVLSSQNFANINIINIVLSSVNHIATSNYWDVHGCTSAAFVPTV